MSADIGDNRFDPYFMNNSESILNSLKIYNKTLEDYDEYVDNETKDEKESFSKPTRQLLFARISFDVKSKIINWNNKLSKLENEQQALLNFISPEININQYLKKEHSDDLLKNDVKWQFGGIKSGVDANYGNYIYGRLGKFRGNVSNFFDELEEDFKLEFRHDRRVCNFLIDLENHIFVYELKRNIGSKGPILVIEKLFNSYYAQSEQLNIDPLKDRTKVAKKISEMRVITAIKLNLHVTNPNSTRLSKQMDEYIKNFGAYKFKLELTSSNKETGINLDANSDILRSGLGLVEEGYGEAEIEGIKKKKWKRNVQTIDTVNLPVSRDVDLGETDKDNIKIFMKTIRDILKMYL